MLCCGTCCAAWCRRCDRPARVRRTVLSAEHVVYAQRALRPRRLPIAMHLVRPRPCAMALRLVLVGPPGPSLRVERSVAAQIMGLELGAVPCGLRFAPSFAHMRQASCAAMPQLRGMLGMVQT